MNIVKVILLTVLVSIQTHAQIKLAITVDDLPTHGRLPFGVTREQVAEKMLATLKKHNVPEVYGFITAGREGGNKEFWDVLKMWRAAGYPLGNHTYTHMSLNKNSAKDFEKEIETNEAALKELNGDKDWKYFRYPYLHEGDTLEKRDAVRNYLKEKKYKIAQVTVDFEDWSWNNPYARCIEKKDEASIKWLRQTYLKNAEDMLDRAEFSTKAIFKKSVPHILLLHIGAFDSEMLDQLITSYKKKGVVFIPLSEAVASDVYSLDPVLPAKWGSEFQYQIMKSRNLSITDIGLKKYEDYPEEKLKKICL